MDKSVQMQGETSAAVVREALELVAQMRSVQMATVGQDAAPLTSYAPFVQHDGALYVYLSGLAQHAQNLRTNPLLCAMLIRDEASCQEIFARPRLVFECTVSEQRRGSALFAAVLDQFVARFGGTAKVLRELEDFFLLRLHPHSARLVSGFARAVDLDDDAMLKVFGAAFIAPPTGGKG